MGKNIITNFDIPLVVKNPGTKVALNDMKNILKDGIPNFNLYHVSTNKFDSLCEFLTDYLEFKYFNISISLNIISNKILAQNNDISKFYTPNSINNNFPDCTGFQIIKKYVSLIQSIFNPVIMKEEVYDEEWINIQPNKDYTLYDLLRSRKKETSETSSILTMFLMTYHGAPYSYDQTINYIFFLRHFPLFKNTINLYFKNHLPEYYRLIIMYDLDLETELDKDTPDIDRSNDLFFDNKGHLLLNKQTNTSTCTTFIDKDWRLYEKNTTPYRFRTQHRQGDIRYDTRFMNDNYEIHSLKYNSEIQFLTDDYESMDHDKNIDVLKQIQISDSDLFYTPNSTVYGGIREDEEEEEMFDTLLASSTRNDFDDDDTANNFIDDTEDNIFDNSLDQSSVYLSPDLDSLPLSERTEYHSCMSVVEDDGTITKTCSYKSDVCNNLRDELEQAERNAVRPFHSIEVSDDSFTSAIESENNTSGFITALASFITSRDDSNESNDFNDCNDSIESSESYKTPPLTSFTDSSYTTASNSSNNDLSLDVEDDIPFNTSSVTIIENNKSNDFLDDFSSFLDDYINNGIVKPTKVFHDKGTITDNVTQSDKETITDNVTQSDKETSTVPPIKGILKKQNPEKASKGTMVNFKPKQISRGTMTYLEENDPDDPDDDSSSSSDSYKSISSSLSSSNSSSSSETSMNTLIKKKKDLITFDYSQLFQELDDSDPELDFKKKEKMFLENQEIFFAPYFLNYSRNGAAINNIINLIEKDKLDLYEMFFKLNGSFPKTFVWNEDQLKRYMLKIGYMIEDGSYYFLQPEIASEMNEQEFISVFGQQHKSYCMDLIFQYGSYNKLLIDQNIGEENKQVMFSKFLLTHFYVYEYMELKQYKTKDDLIKAIKFTNINPDVLSVYLQETNIQITTIIKTLYTSWAMFHKKENRNAIIKILDTIKHFFYVLKHFQKNDKKNLPLFIFLAFSSSNLKVLYEYNAKNNLVLDWLSEFYDTCYPDAKRMLFLGKTGE